MEGESASIFPPKATEAPVGNTDDYNFLNELSLKNHLELIDRLRLRAVARTLENYRCDLILAKKMIKDLREESGIR